VKRERVGNRKKIPALRNGQKKKERSSRLLSRLARKRGKREATALAFIQEKGHGERGGGGRGKIGGPTFHYLIRVSKGAEKKANGLKSPGIRKRRDREAGDRLRCSRAARKADPE